MVALPKSPVHHVFSSRITSTNQCAYTDNAAGSSFFRSFRKGAGTPDGQV